MENNKLCSLKMRGIRFRKTDKFLLLLMATSIFFTADFLFHTYEKVRSEANTVYMMQLTAQLASALRDVHLLQEENSHISDILLENIGDRTNTVTEEENPVFQKLLENFKKIQFYLQNKSLPKFEWKLSNVSRDNGPSTKFEMARRRFESGVHEMWFYFGSEFKQLKQLTQNDTELYTRIGQILEEGVEHKRTILKESQRLPLDDGYSKWREQEAKELSDLVQQRLQRLQNPRDCSNRRKLVCKVNKFCGYSCEVNHVMYCLMEALGTQRTMVLESEHWIEYFPQIWSDVFLPVSNCSSSGHVSEWPGTFETPAIFMDFVESSFPKPEFLPLSIPRELAARVSRLHGDPAAWWVGQFWRYLLRPQPVQSSIIEQSAAKLNFHKPVVGVHIRRSDKLKEEAKFHALEEYMSVVEEYYTQLELSQHVEKRRVFIATDDPSVFAEAKTKYPTYEILGDTDTSAKASSITERLFDLYGAITDIHFLAHSDFIVCTFSSGMCRLAYEIMQSLHADASARFRSLDDIYLSSGQQEPRLRQAVMSHRAVRDQEIDLEIGDVVEVAGNHWDGFSLGTNRRTTKQGLYPSHKVVEELKLKDYPSFVLR